MSFRPNKKISQSDIYQTAKKVCDIFQKQGFEAYIVGGCVRDFILFPTLIPKDIDIGTNASVEHIQSLFPDCTLVGKSFGVCIVRYQRFSFEVATFRKDGPYLDRRHPSTVSTGSLFEDSQRRDFTMNAIYYSPSNEKIIDFHDGVRDISKKIVRCVGQADARIYEDALRILRCLRFSANFKFKIEKSLLVSIKKHADGLKFIPMERILEEISKVFDVQDFVDKLFKYLNISIFFKSFVKKSLNTACNPMVKPQDGVQWWDDTKHAQPPKLKLLNNFRFSLKSNFFDFFVVFFRYADVSDFEELKKELKALPCTLYDAKLCLWFLSLIQLDKMSCGDSKMSPQALQFLSEGFPSSSSTLSLSSRGLTAGSIPLLYFFKELILIERIEKAPNPKIFLILKKLLSNKLFVKIVTAYTKRKDDFSKARAVANLKQKNVSEKNFSSIILNEYFLFITKNL